MTHGRIEVRPITLLIGPNNVGKSYTAMTLYALMGAIRRLVKCAGCGDPRDVVVRSLERVFLSSPTSLIRRGARVAAASLVYEDGASLSDVTVEVGEEGVRVSAYVDAPPRARIPRVLYIPASRSGLLQSYATLVSALLEALPLASRGALLARGLPGTAADMLTAITLAAVRGRRRLEDVAGAIERDVLGGEVAVVVEGRVPRIVYRVGDAEYDASTSSSMVSELAPLIVLIRSLVERGSVLIIEEPEAHLHPAAQVRLMDALARLATAHGVGLVMTTHSDVLLARLNILVMCGVVRPWQVAAYRFVRRGDDVCVEELRVSEEGVPEDEFAKVYEELHGETLKAYWGTRLNMITS